MTLIICKRYAIIVMLGVPTYICQAKTQRVCSPELDAHLETCAAKCMKHLNVLSVRTRYVERSDITHLSIALLKYRLTDMFPGIKFRVVGDPQDLASARQLAAEDRYQFQWWALSLVRAKPLGGQEGSKTGKKGSDKGIDGVITFIDHPGKAQRVLVQVKSGHVKSGDIRDLVGTIDSEKAAMGVFITLEPTTSEMTAAALKAGFYHSPAWGRDFPRIQILTIADLLKGTEIKMPPAYGTFKQAQKVLTTPERQAALDLE